MNSPEVGDRVHVASTSMLQPAFVGTLRYLGPVAFKEGTWAGIELDPMDPEGRPQQGKNDGSVDGKRYFWCPSMRGIFVSSSRVQQLQPKSTSLSVSKLVTAGGFDFDRDLYKSTNNTSAAAAAATKKLLFEEEKPRAGMVSEANPFIVKKQPQNSVGWLFVKEALDGLKQRLPANDASTTEFERRLLSLIRAIQDEKTVKFSPEDASSSSEAINKSLISRYRDEVDRLQEQLDRQLSIANELAEEKMHLAAQLSRAQSEIDRVKEESNLRLAVVRNSPKPQAINNSVALRTVEEKLHEANRDLETTKAELQRTREALADSQGNIRSMKQDLAYKESTIKNLTADLNSAGDDVTRRLSDSQREVQRLQRELIEVNRAKDNTERFFQTKIDSLQTKVDTLKGTERDLLDREDALNRREQEMLEQQEQTWRQFDQKLAQIHKEMQEKDAQIRKLSSEREDPSSMRMVSEDRVHQMEDRLQAERHFLQSQLAAVRAELAEKQRQSEYAEQEVERFANLLHDQRTAITRLEAQLEESRKRVSWLETDSREAKLSVISDASNTTSVKDTSLLAARLERQLALVDKEKRLLEEEVQRLRRITSDAREMVASVRASREKLALHSPELLCRATEMHARIDAIDAELEHVPWNVWLASSLNAFRRRLLGIRTGVGN